MINQPHEAQQIHMSLKVLITSREKNAEQQIANGSVRSEYTLDSPITIIGSDAQASHIYVPDRHVAPEHVIIIREDGPTEDSAQFVLINRAPQKTRFNDETLEREARRELFHGDQLLLGSFVLTFTFSEYVMKNGTAKAQAEAGLESRSQNLQPVAEKPLEPILSNITIAAPQNPPVRSFEAILNNLRTEEDSYHFRIVGGHDNGRRIVLNQPEIPLGWEEDGVTIGFNAARVVNLCAIIRKEWSGVNLEVSAPQTIAVNGQFVEGLYRLHNEDVLTVTPPANVKGERPTVSLSFHEPASLVALSAMLPPPVSLEKKQSEGKQSATPQSDFNTSTVSPALPRPASQILTSRHKILGYYPLEWLVMTIGTLLAAVVIFLVLELTS